MEQFECQPRCPALGQQSLSHPPSAALAGIHPTYHLLGFSAALAPKFPPLHPVVDSGSGKAENCQTHCYGLGFVSDSLVPSRWFLKGSGDGSNFIRLWFVLFVRLSLAPKFPPLLPVVDSGSSKAENCQTRCYGHGFVSDSLVPSRWFLKGLGDGSDFIRLWFGLFV